MLGFLVVLYVVFTLMTWGFIASVDGDTYLTTEQGALKERKVTKQAFRRDGETGAHALARVTSKALLWPLLLLYCLLWPGISHLWKWLTQPADLSS